jgi:hypothetical protein
MLVLPGIDLIKSLSGRDSPFKGAHGKGAQRSDRSSQLAYAGDSSVLGTELGRDESFQWRKYAL